MGFSKTLFVFDHSSFGVKCLSLFHVSVFKAWRLMETERFGKSTSLHLLLLEPILKGSSLGSSWDDVAMM